MKKQKEKTERKTRTALRFHFCFFILNVYIVPVDVLKKKTKKKTVLKRIVPNQITQEKELKN